jgi:aerobic carbon-monoxide dehydrogenase large subunit
MLTTGGATARDRAGDSGGYIGASPPRAEDSGLVRGAHRYVADFEVADCLEACFVRSFEAHGLLGSVDVSAATEVEGVVAAYGAADLPGLPEVPFGSLGEPAPGMARPALARERVRFAGEPVAVILARDRYAAEDGAELVLPDIESLPAVLDPTAAAQDDAPRLFEGVSNIAAVTEYGAPVTEIMDSAPVVVTMSIRNERLVPTSIEARGVLVVPEDDGRLTIWVSHQAPHRLRRELAGALDIDTAKIRVVVPKVGGAFGAKSQTFAEFVVVAHLALEMQKPIRWIEDRREALQGATQGRGQNQRLRLAAETDGRMLALEAFIDADIGAYPHNGAFVPGMTGWLLSGAYAIPHLYARVRSIVTNATPTAPYRGAGRPEAAFALERLVDVLARRLGIDPIEVRLANFIAPSDFPYQSPTGALYDSGDHAEALRRAQELAGYETLRAEQQRRRSTDDGRLLGIGIATWVERSGGQPGSWEFGGVEVNGDGTIVARSGSTAQGQGHETAFAQVVASAFGIGLERVRVVQGDTDQVANGFGTFASRSMQVGGSALHQASVEVIEAARQRALNELEVAEDDLVYSAGVFSVAGTDRSIDLARLAADGPLAATVDFAPPQAFPFGAYIAVVEIERDSGAIALTKLIAVDDCGVVVNPSIVKGQVLGSIAQGLGQALYERVAYDEWGQPLFGTLMDYSLPTLSEIPEIVLGETVTPNPNVPLGTKGAGEAGCIGAPPAVVNAIADALEGAEETLDMPVTPEKVWRVLARRTAPAQ